MNILILSAGTRCQLVKYFKQSTNGFDRVVTTDCSKYAPAIYMSDTHYLVPEMSEDCYLPTILKICKREQINAVLPLQEDELELIARHKNEFENLGILAIVCGLEAVKICRDKYKLYQKLKAVNIRCVETYDYETEIDLITKLPLPILVKERKGKGSVGALKINTRTLLPYFAENTEEKLVVQPYLEAKEYGVDSYVDFISGEIIAIFAKEKIKMKAGETEKSKSYKNQELFALVEKTIKEMGLRGPIDMDIFEYKGTFYLLEINPRFGGGYPHAYECGVDFMTFICNNAAGKRNIPCIGQYLENKVLLKYTEAMLKNEEDMF